MRTRIDTIAPNESRIWEGCSNLLSLSSSLGQQCDCSPVTGCHHFTPKPTTDNRPPFCASLDKELYWCLRRSLFVVSRDSLSLSRERETDVCCKRRCETPKERQQSTDDLVKGWLPQCELIALSLCVCDTMPLGLGRDTRSCLSLLLRRTGLAQSVTHDSFCFPRTPRGEQSMLGEKCFERLPRPPSPKGAWRHRRKLLDH